MLPQFACTTQTIATERSAQRSAAHFVVVSVLLSILVGVLPFGSVDAHASQGLQVEQHSNTVRLVWTADPRLLQRNVNTSTSLTAPFDHTFLTPKLITLRVIGKAYITPQIDLLDATPLPFDLPTSALTGLESTPALAQNNTALPEAPMVVVREGQVRDQRIVVVAVNPVFEQAHVAQLVSKLEVSIPGTQLLSENTAQAVNSMGLSAVASQPPNQLAGRAALKIQVSEAGMQRITGSALAAAGWNVATINPKHIQLRRKGVPVRLEEWGTGDGQLDSIDELRFYAPEPEDRWNSSELYWLTLETTSGLRLGQRSTLPADAPVRTTALVEGVWRNNTFYDSLLPGPDGDHWFAANLQTGPGRPTASLDVALSANLPIAEGTSQLVISGSTYTSNLHQLSVRVGSETVSRQWSGGSDWQQTFSFGDISSSIQLALVPGTNTDSLEPDNIRWSRPATLDFGQRGAQFSGVAGTWRYRLANLPPHAELYDVTDPTAPAKLSLALAATGEFEDGPQPRQYLLAGPGTIHSPPVVAHQPIDLVTPVHSDALYIAPAAFHAALAPLVAHREAQGYATRLIDVQAIYDTWSFGAVSPTAIRQFLQYNRARAQRPPSHIILVGDGTSDPLNYTKRNNTNFIPPFLAMVDPWIGETACETCYAQLDGEDPLSDSLPDVALGRLPVKSTAELTSLVRKLIDYDTATNELEWRARSVYIADNTDRAGDFAAMAESSAALQPNGVDVQRMYYDPTTSITQKPWTEPDPVRAYQRTLDALNAGAAFVNYVGHSYYWQWGLTDPTATPPNLLGLYDPDKLTNGKRLPVVLEMTCLTSAFQQPAYSGTTIDERLLLNSNGGAIAVWGPTGMGIAHGHDALQRGFYQAFWQQAGEAKTLGSLVNAGFLELFMSSSCCQDTLRTFALLGDPLTVPLGVQRQALYLPLIRR